jgi:hypothetical protein
MGKVSPVFPLLQFRLGGLAISRVRRKAGQVHQLQNRVMMKSTIATLVGLAITVSSVLSLAQERQKMPLSDSEVLTKSWTAAGFGHFMTGPELKATRVAMDAFTAEFTSSNIENYSVGVRETPDAFEVWLSPVPDLEHRPKDWIGYGKNTFGKEVHYTISKGEYKITRARAVP